MSNSSTNSGIGVFGLLGVVFVTLKLLDKIDWSWWYVTLPFWWWIPAMVVVAILTWIIAVITMMIGKR